jgi:hypothetical protein
VRELFGETVDWTSMERGTLEVTAFPEPEAFAAHFRERYGPTIAARRNAAANGREEEFDATLEAVFREARRDGGGPADGGARYELEYLISVGTRR